MRFATAGIVLATALVLPASAADAQRAGNFDDSWFWGLKGGVNTFSTGDGGHASVPTWGLDWLITRSKGGLYVTGDESFFGRSVTAVDPASSSGSRQVRINNMRRIGFAGVIFPHRFGAVRPYAGLGAALSILGSAVAQKDSAGKVAGQSFVDRTERERSRASLLVMAGAQVQMRRAALFAQETVLPGGPDFLIRSAMSFLEVGIRYNFGTSIESSR